MVLRPRCKGSTLSRHVRGLGFDSRVRTLFLLIFVVFTLCLPCYSSLLAHVQLSVVLRPRCKGSTLSRHVRGLEFDSRVRTLFSIDLCCIYLVFTMLFIFVKRMYSKARCSVPCVKVSRFPGMSEVYGSIAVSGLCFLLNFVVFIFCLPCYSSLLIAYTVKRDAPSTASCLTLS